MNLLKNKHLIIAMFVAPLLAVIAYFGVDYVVSEKPHTAVEGASYKLIAKSNCRYKSGICTFENGDIEVKLKLEVIEGNQTNVFLRSELPIQNAVVSFVNDLGYEKLTTDPVTLNLTEKPSGENMNTLFATVNSVPNEKSEIRLAISISDTMYYAETTTVFMNLETSFSRENFTENK